MKKGGTGVGVGTSSILMVFVLLCLTTFAALSLVSANADNRLTTRAAETLSDFYEADAQAERVLAELSDVLAASRSASTEGEYRALYTLRAVNLSHPVTFEGATASFTVDAGETQRLEVVLQLPFGEEALYRKLQWQMIPNAWQSEENADGINIWGGNGDGDGFATIPMF